MNVDAKKDGWEAVWKESKYGEKILQQKLT